MTIFKKQERETLKTTVLKEIKKAIFTRKLKPGDHIIEAELAEQMGISRFPIREAISSLEKEGLVVTVPYKGAYVTEVNIKALEELYTVRSALEELAIRILMEKKSSKDIKKLESIISDMEKAALKRNEALVSEDMRFHQTICELTGHQKLLEMWLTLKDQLMLFVALEEHSYDQPNQLVRAHYPVMEAIKSGDAQRAEKCIRDHLTEAMNILKEILRSSGQEQAKS